MTVHNIKCPTCGRLTPDASFCEYCGRALYSCKFCKAMIPKDAIFCPECGKAVTQGGKELKSREHVSWVWWLLPALPSFLPGFIGILGFSWLGGIIAWGFNRKRDPVKARSMLWLGLSLLIIAIVVMTIAYAMGWTWAPIDVGN